jgi:transcriptional regulator with XRE-family HTH domain
MTLEQAAEALGVSTMTVRRIELAATPPDAGQISVLLEAYGVSATTAEQVMASLVAAAKPGWWHRYRSVLRPADRQVLGIESAASVIRVWDPGLVPELLRTPAYAAAVVRQQHVPESTVSARLELLAERQRRLAERDCVLWVLIPQSVLYTMVGGREAPEVMREQYAALAAAAIRPRTRVQVVPLAAPPHPLTGAPALSILRVLPQSIPDYLVLHGPAWEEQADLRDDDLTVTRYRLRLDLACAGAPDPRTPLSLPDL